MTRNDRYPSTGDGEETGAVVWGLRGDVQNVEDLLARVNEASRDLGLEIQLLDAGRVYGREHLEVAVERALRAFATGRNLAKNIPVEVLLYASGMRQISKAMEFMGLKVGMTEMAMVAIATGRQARDIPDDLSSRLGLERDDTVLEGSEDVLRAFGIDKESTKGIPEEYWSDLILERMALLELEK